MPLIRVDTEDRSALARGVELRNAANRVDDPETPPTTVELSRLHLRYGWDLDPPQQLLYFPVAEGSSRAAPIGMIEAQMPRRDNEKLADVDFLIHPDHRRQGHGTAMLQELRAWVREHGRSLIWAYPAADRPDAAAFAQRHGFRYASQDARRHQQLSEVDQVAVNRLRAAAEQAATGYRLERLMAPTSTEVLADLVEVTAAINDAPMGSLDFEPEHFDLARLQDSETAAERKGERMYRVIARRISDGEVGGHTVMAIRPSEPTWAHQYDTSVARAHRGHRLGLLLKIDMMHWLAEVEPHVKTVETWNNADNRFMIDVNEQLGYRLSKAFDAYELKL